MKACPKCGLKYPDDHVRCLMDRSELQAVPDPWVGKLLNGRYVLEQVLGEGGMATVYSARDNFAARPAAVKMMAAHMARDAKLKERFRREARNTAAVAHPNIIDIYDYGETDDGTPFLVMELLLGEPLEQWIERGPMPPDVVASVGVQIAKGLARAHDFSVVHRDLKPDNIFLVGGADGTPLTVKILDFGIGRSMEDARLTVSGQIFGTPQYLAPERVTSTDTGASVDLYALGVILFEMLTGRLPFEADDIPGFLVKHMHEPPPRPSTLARDVPPALEELVLRLLAKSVDERPVDAHAVIRALEPLLARQPSTLPLPTMPLSGTLMMPVIPPTALERWRHRATLYEHMIQRAFPPGSAPPRSVAAVMEMRAIVARLGELRELGLRDQSKLEALEKRATESRERLGHAVHVLALDLSSAREALRSARNAIGAQDEVAAQARRTYVAAHEALMRIGAGRPVESPSPAAIAVARELADALHRWSLALRSNEDTQSGVPAAAAQVSDLEFQLTALRAQVERLQGHYDDERRETEAVLRRAGLEMATLEERLGRLGSEVAVPLRGRSDLIDLFARLEEPSM
jgi:serine/threonine-protein kinase